MTPLSAELDTDLVLDHLVDECHQTHGWLRDVLDAARDLDPGELDHIVNPPVNATAAAWTILSGLLAKDCAQLPAPVQHRLEARLGVDGVTAVATAADREVEAASVLCRMFAVAAVRSASEAGDEEEGPALARALIDDLHERMRPCIGCIEWLSGLREGKLARRNTIRDGRLADRAYLEAVRLFQDL